MYCFYLCPRDCYCVLQNNTVYIILLPIPCDLLKIKNILQNTNLHIFKMQISHSSSTYNLSLASNDRNISPSQAWRSCMDWLWTTSPSSLHFLLEICLPATPMFSPLLWGALPHPIIAFLSVLFLSHFLSFMFFSMLIPVIPQDLS